MILVTGDNGTFSGIKSNMGDKVIVGGKGKPTDAGTHVALIAYQPGTVPAGSVSKTLVEFSDFVPTVAEATGVAPLSYRWPELPSATPRKEGNSPRHHLRLLLGTPGKIQAPPIRA